MSDFIEGFKKFIMRGNVLDLAVAVIIGGAFGLVVNAFTDGVIMAFIAAIVGQPSFDSITIDIGDGQIFIGSFITALVNFVIVAFVIYSIIQAYEKSQTPEAEAEAGPSDSDHLAAINSNIQKLVDATQR